MDVINPATGATIKSYANASTEAVATILEDVQTDWLAWRKTNFAQRAQLMRDAAKVLRKKQAEFALLMTEEMGKPITQGKAEIEKCAWVCEYYAENAATFLQSQSIKTEASNSFIAFQPIGIVLAVMPWNFPFWQVFRFAAPALMAGNAAVLKHASNVPDCALAIEQVFREAGFPQHIFRTLLIGGDKVGDVIANPLVQAVTLTGSTPAGKSVASIAGQHLKKTVLELGGSDAYLILEDADIELAAKACITSRMRNNGQSCIAAKRFIVVQSVYEAFKKQVLKEVEAYPLGDPLLETTKLGPMARVDLRNELHEQVQQSIALGATCVLGGSIPQKAGAWYPATVLTNVKPGMPAYNDELFGPVASLIKVKDEAEAIAVANSTPFGLGAAVFTRNQAHGQMIAETQLEAGACFVNQLVSSDPRLPFGGIKQSGYGRELSHFGIQEFVNIKSVSVL